MKLLEFVTRRPEPRPHCRHSTDLDIIRANWGYTVSARQPPRRRCRPAMGYVGTRPIWTSFGGTGERGTNVAAVDAVFESERRRTTWATAPCAFTARPKEKLSRRRPLRHSHVCGCAPSPKPCGWMRLIQYEPGGDPRYSKGACDVIPKPSAQIACVASWIRSRPSGMVPTALARAATPKPRYAHPPSGTA